MTTHTYDKDPLGILGDEPKSDDPLGILTPPQPSKKKVGGEEPQYTFPTSLSEVLSTGRRKTQEDEKNKFIKPLPPQTFQQGLQKDKLEYSFQPEKKGSYWGGVYNTVVDLVGKIGGGAAETVRTIQDASDQLNEAILGGDTGQGSMVRTKDPTRREQITQEQVTAFVDKARSASSTKENEAARSQFDVTDGVQKEDVEALMFQAPKTILSMLAGAGTGGTTFFFESTNDVAKELKESGVEKDLSAGERLGIIATLGTAQSVLEKFGIDKVLKSTGLSKKVQQKLANEVVQELSKKGVKATTQEIEKLMLQKASKLSSQISRIGVKAATSFLAEGGTEVAQEVADSGLKLLANKVTGKKVFNEQDITANFIKNAINAGAMGGVFGGGIGGAVGVLNNTKKGLRNQIAQAQSPQDVAKIQQDINEQVELGNITPQEAEAANITAQQYAEIAAKIPQEIDSEKKYALIGGIEQREDLTRELQNIQEELAATDPAFHKDIEARAELLNAKLEQTNDYIDGLVTGKKYTYKKADGGFFKTDSEGNEIEITPLHYELATAIREQDAINNKKPEINPNDQKTFTFTEDEDVPNGLDNPIAIQQTQDGKIDATYSGEQLIKAGLAEKAPTQEEVQDDAVTVLNKAIDKGKVTGVYADLAKQDPQAVLKDIAKQAQNLNEDFTPLNDGREDAARQATEEAFGAKVVDAAVTAYPAAKAQPKVKASQDVLTQPSNLIELKDTEVKVPVVDGTRKPMKYKDAFVELKKQYKQLDNVLTKCL